MSEFVYVEIPVSFDGTWKRHDSECPCAYCSPQFEPTRESIFWALLRDAEVRLNLSYSAHDQELVRFSR